MDDINVPRENSGASETSETSETGEPREIWYLSPEQWDQFIEYLDAPARELPKLRKLLFKPTVFDQ